MDKEEIDSDQRLKAATYYTIKKISKEVEEDKDVSISAKVLATLNESLHRQAAKWARDIEHFAKHARRSEMNIQDVRLLARNNEVLMQHLDKMTDDLKPLECDQKKAKGGKVGKGRPKKNKEDTAVVDVAVIEDGEDE